jgi:hypothetical protein
MYFVHNSLKMVAVQDKPYNLWSARELHTCSQQLNTMSWSLKSPAIFSKRGSVPRRLFFAPNSLTSCSVHFISIEGSSVRLLYSRNIPHSVLQCLCLGKLRVYYGLDFPFSKLSKATVKLAAQGVMIGRSLVPNYVYSTEGKQDPYLEKQPILVMFCLLIKHNRRETSVFIIKLSITGGTYLFCFAQWMSYLSSLLSSLWWEDSRE